MGHMLPESGLHGGGKSPSSAKIPCESRNSSQPGTVAADVQVDRIGGSPLTPAHADVPDLNPTMNRNSNDRLEETKELDND